MFALRVVARAHVCVGEECFEAKSEFTRDFLKSVQAYVWRSALNPSKVAQRQSKLSCELSL